MQSRAAVAAMYDVAIVGGGPAGLSAALVLGRCRRRVLVCDDRRPRNASSRAVHNFLSREGIRPDQLLRIARAQLRSYDVDLWFATVTKARRRESGFTLELADGRQARARALLMASGICDATPDIPGIERWLGRGVYFCSYCDGYTVREQPLVSLGRGTEGAELALALTTWSPRVTYCTHGTRRPNHAVCERLASCGIPVYRAPIVRLEGDNQLEAIHLRNGQRVPCRGLFIQEGDRQRSDLARRLGCTFTRRGTIAVRHDGQTAIPLLFAAGDAADQHRAVIVAAASGARAAFAINKQLRELAQATRRSMARGAINCQLNCAGRSSGNATPHRPR